MTILNKNFLGKESHENKRFCKKQKVFYMYKEHLLKIWGGYCNSFQNGALWTYGFEKPVFPWKKKVSKARNTTIKMIYIIKLYILRPIFQFFYDILHCATQQNNFRPLCNVEKHHTAVRNSNYRPLFLFCLYDSILYNSFLN